MTKITYQPEWVRGAQTDAPFQRDCEDRYKPIRDICARFSRPFSVLDLGANAGWFSFRIAEEFPHATVIAVDDKPQLVALARRNALPNVVVIPRRLTARQLQRLAECEVFDVALALNVLHHMKRPEAALAALGSLAWQLVVETPGPGDRNAAHPERHGPIAAALEHHAAGFRLLATGGSHVTEGAERRLYGRCSGLRTCRFIRQTIDVAAGGYTLAGPATFRPGEDRNAPPISHTVLTQDFDAATIRIEREKAGTVETRPFIAGINLWNFALLGGCIPADPAALVRAEVARLEGEGRWMDDLRPWNFVLDGRQAHAIDIGWKAWRTEPEPGGLDKCLALLEAAHR